MFKQKALSAVILASAGTLGVPHVYAQEPAPIEEVVIVGIRASLNQAADRKRTAELFQDSIVAEDIGKFPDQNVAESLQRITGVTISRVNGEGSQVSVRSFGPNFNIVKLNHRTLATTTGQRSFDFQILPSELIGGADVIKSPTADLRAGSSGAYINVRSARPLDNPGFNAVVAGKVNYQDMAEEFNPEINGLISNTFADDTIGIMLGATFKETENRIDNYRASIWTQFAGSGFGFPIDSAVGEDGQPLVGEDGEPTNPNLPGARGPGRTIWSMVDENRERTGATAVFQWEPNENFSTTVDFLYAKLERDVLGSGLQVPNQSSSKYTEAVISDSGTLLRATLADTDIEMNIDYADEESTTSAIGWNSVFTQGALTLEFDAAYSKSEGDNVFDNTTVPHYTFFDENGDKIPNTTLTVDYTNDVPDLTTTGGLDVTDISKIRAAWQRLAGNEIEDEITELKLDALYEIDAGVVQSVKAGVSYEDRTLALDAFGTEFDAESGGATWNGAGMWIGDGSTWGDDPTIGLLSDEIFTLTDNDFMSGVSGNFPRQWVALRDHDQYRAATQEHLEHLVATRESEEWRAPIVEAGWDTLYHGPADSYLNDEETVEAYAMVNFEGELGDALWSGNLGIRYVDISNTAQSRASTIDLLTLDENASSLPDNVVNAATTSAEDVSVKTSEDHLLPSLNLKLDLGGGHILRTAAAQTITRPSLADMSANFTESPGISTAVVRVGGGNPFLESYEVTQFDFGYEFYADDDSAYSATFFYKDITNFISTFNTSGPWQGPIEQRLVDAYAANGQVVQFSSNQKNNRDGGTVQGLELGALYHFSGALDGFGVQANYTYSDSEDDDALPIDQPLVPEPDSSLEGFAENSYNLIAFYDKHGFQARLAYNWRDSFMSCRSCGDGDLPIFTEDFGQFDLNVSYDITNNLTVFLEGINLTDEDRLQYLAQRDRVSLVQQTGRRFQAGVRANF